MWHLGVAGALAHRRDPNELIARRDGAARCARSGRLRRFVMTSSVAAVAYGRGRGVHTFTEADWTDPDRRGTTPYVQSKTIAERAARDLVAQQGGGIEYCSINPSVVLGPVWSRDYSPSVVVVRKLLDGSMGACPDIGFGIVDVRDVADLHVRALKAPGMAGERFIASGPFLKLREIADILRARMGDEARKVTTRNMADWMVRIAAYFNPLQVGGQRAGLGAPGRVHAKTVLGWTPRPVEQASSTPRCLIDLGIEALRPAAVDDAAPLTTLLRRSNCSRHTRPYLQRVELQRHLFQAVRADDARRHRR
jgi:dihydroflavonol-4-reductase